MEIGVRREVSLREILRSRKRHKIPELVAKG